MLARSLECYGSDTTGVVSETARAIVGAYAPSPSVGCPGGFENFNQLSAYSGIACGLFCQEVKCWGRGGDAYGVVARTLASPLVSAQAFSHMGARTSGDYIWSQWCDAGHFAGAGDMEECYPCPPGQYQPSDYEGWCLVCPPTTCARGGGVSAHSSYAYPHARAPICIPPIGRPFGICVSPCARADMHSPYWPPIRHMRIPMRARRYAFPLLAAHSAYAYPHARAQFLAGPGERRVPPVRGAAWLPVPLQHRDRRRGAVPRGVRPGVGVGPLGGRTWSACPRALADMHFPSARP